MIINKKYELLQTEHEKTRKSLGKAENELIATRDKIKQNAVGKKSDKEDYRQTIIKMEQKLAQISHELRKKDAVLVKLQGKVSKDLMSNVIYKNSYEYTAKLNNLNENIYEHFTNTECKNFPIHQLSLMLKGGYEENQHHLLDENSRLKECIRYLQDELVNILNEVIKTALGKAPKLSEKILGPINIKPIVFNLPMGGIINDVYGILRENICRIRDSLNIILTI